MSYKEDVDRIMQNWASADRDDVLVLSNAFRNTHEALHNLVESLIKERKDDQPVKRSPRTTMALINAKKVLGIIKEKENG